MKTKSLIIILILCTFSIASLTFGKQIENDRYSTAEILKLTSGDIFKLTEEEIVALAQETLSTPLTQEEISKLKQPGEVWQLASSIKKEMFKTIEPEILEIVRKKLKLKIPNNFITKNIFYVDLENTLPKVEDLAFICIDKNQKSKIWFEFTNFKFLVNAENSNNLVKIYIGDINETDNLENVYRQPIGIYDPESAFVFQRAIIRFWDNLPKNYGKNIDLMLFKALEVGYSALSYHFEFSDSLDVTVQTPYPTPTYQKNKDEEKSIFDFNELLYKRYASEVKSIDRFVAQETIEKRKEIGLVAYYPSPIYLNDMAWYIRPKDMDYKTYARACAALPPTFTDNYGEDHLLKFRYSDYDVCDEYTQILDGLYPNGIISFNNTSTNTIHQVKLKRISTIAYRGDLRSPEEIASKDVGGFWPRLCPRKKQPVGIITDVDEAKRCQPEDLIVITKNNKEKMLADDSYFQFLFMDRIGIIPYKTAHISASTDFNSAIPSSHPDKYYAYAFFAKGTFNLPSLMFGKITDQNGFRETTPFGGVAWKNIAGAREKKGYSEKDIGIGPIFLKNNLAEKDQESFWEILQIMGGKPQFFSHQKQREITNICLNKSENNDENPKLKVFEKIFLPSLGYSPQEIQTYFENIDEDEKNQMTSNAVDYCQDLLQMYYHSSHFKRMR